MAPGILHCLWVVLASQVVGSTAEATVEEEARTVSDPAVSISVLEWLLKPFTQDQLEVEAMAWRDLVAAKVKEEAEAEIRVIELNAEIAEAEESLEDSAGNEADGVAPVSDGSGTDADMAAGDGAAPGPQAATGEQEQEKAALLEALPRLRTERVALVNRAGAVADAWEAKGGDAEQLRKYLAEVSGLVALDVTDLSATRAAVEGWITSPEGGIRWGINLVKCLALLVTFWALGRFARRLVTRAVAHARLTHLMKDFITVMTGRAVLGIGLVMAIAALGINVGPLLAIVGAAGFVVAFALQDSLGNFASGIMILFYRPFDVGDVVDVAGVTGKVDSLSLVSTTIRTPDNKVVVVPNNAVWGGVITNATGSQQRRVDLVFGIGYGDDIAQAQEIMERVVGEHPKVLKDPAPVVRVHELSDSSVNFVCRPWVETADYWDVYWDLTRAVKEEFDREGVSIPFPQRDVHVYQHRGDAEDSGRDPVKETREDSGRDRAAEVEEERGQAQTA